MYIHIFSQENQTDFKRIEVFVVGFQNKSIDIKDGKEIVTLSWNSDFTIEDLLYDDILNIYIKGDDFTKGYVFPILQDLNIKDLDASSILDSEFDKRDQAHKKEMEIKLNILKKLIEHDTKRSIEEYQLFKEILKSRRAESRDFDILKETGVYLINGTIKEKIADAAALFKAIRKQISLYPNPCYCIRKAIENAEFFSLLLGLKPYYFTYKSQRSQRGKQLGLDLLIKTETILMKSFDYWRQKESDSKLIDKINFIRDNIREIIESYKSSNKLKLYAHGSNGVLEQHPNLKLDYFKIIDTLEKAYWLGWLFAEGYITIKKLKSGKKYYQLGVGCVQDDFILLERFADALGLDIVNNEPRKEKYITSKGEVHVFRRITLINNFFCKNLISHGFIVGKKKSKNIRLPKFKIRELLLSFLLGYYDGDGTMGRSRITSGSEKFLEDILNSPFLNIHISNSNSIQYDPVKKSYIITGDRISLGADLMRDIVKNYKNSLPRKRAYWENWVDNRTNKPSPKMDLLREKLPEEELINLMKKFTLKQIAYMYGVGYRTLMEYKRKLNIYLRDRPPENS